MIISGLKHIKCFTPFLYSTIYPSYCPNISFKKILDLSKYIPEQIINRTKKGFNSPFNEWLQDEFGSSILDTIIEVNRQTAFFNENYLKQIYTLASSNKFKQHLYSLFVFSLWYKKVYL